MKNDKNFSAHQFLSQSISRDEMKSLEIELKDENINPEKVLHLHKRQPSLYDQNKVQKNKPKVNESNFFVS